MADSIQATAKRDSLPRDSATVDLRNIKISGEGLNDEVEYKARDSMWFDVKRKQVHLYGAASVKYTSLNITAGYILLDYEKSEISAQPFPDTAKQLVGLPEFKDKEQEFTAGRLRYNFKTRKGVIYEARTKQEDLYVLGERAKFVGAQDSRDTTGTTRNTIYNSNALVTSCDADHPHFGIRTRKLKVIPNKVVVTGFSNLEVGGVPTPLVLPFGFFPITKTRKAGLIIPRDFEFADREGLGIKDFGWYHPINDHLDATVIFNAYTSGSWGVSSTARYDYNYKYDGNFQLTYNDRVTEDKFAQRNSFKSFGLRWTHNQDPKAHPTRRFGGSVQIETNRNQNRNRNDFQSVYQNTLRSNINYSRTFPGKPYNFNASFDHSQNTQTRTMEISLPSAAFNMQRIFPFARKERVGQEKWFEKISFTYSARLQNQLSTVDTLLFTKRTLQSARMGIQHNASTDFAFKVFKYITVTPNVSYEENWYPYSIEKELIRDSVLVYDPVVNAEGDTIARKLNEAKSRFGIDTTYRNWGLYAFRKYNAGISSATALFMTKQFRHGWLRGVRHTFKPSVSVGFGPDFTNPKYYRYVETDTRREYNDTLRYSIYDEGIFGKPVYGKRDIALSYSLINLLEIKHRVKRDTLDPNAKDFKKVRIFDNLGFSGSYSLTADSLRFSTIGTGGLFRLFKGISNLTWQATFDPYIGDAKGKRINKYALHEQGRLLRTTHLGVQLNTGFRISQLRELFGKKGGTPSENGTGSGT
ncbi:MAG TPA: putative LPS assembly protein LptD, partial [Saprospiraceae bacterium]|nr:putative LPS assembly protein LptD [Saprospiraceae bacterium]